jgi:hypothetical protein
MVDLLLADFVITLFIACFMVSAPVVEDPTRPILRGLAGGDVSMGSRWA